MLSVKNYDSSVIPKIGHFPLNRIDYYDEIITLMILATEIVALITLT